MVRASDSEAEDAGYNSSGLVYSSLDGTVKTLGSVVFAFGFAPSLLHAYQAANERLHEVEVFDRILQITVLLGVALCFVTGLAGYYTFREGTLPNILENYNSGALGVLIKVPFIVHLTFYIPADFVIVRYSLLRLLQMDISTVSNTFNVVSSVVLLGAVAVASCFIMMYADSGTSLALLLQITGGIAGSLLNFIFPALVGLALLPRTAENRFQIAAVMALGVTVPVLVVASLCGVSFAV